KHGFGLPFGPWLATHEPLRQIALDSVTDLKRRRIIRPEFIDELTSVHVRSHADYYGTMVWVLMRLEQWFRRSDPAHGPLTVCGPSPRSNLETHRGHYAASKTAYCRSARHSARRRRLCAGLQRGSGEHAP